MLVRRVVDHQLGDHPDAAFMGRFQKGLEVLEIAVERVNARVVGDVVAVVLQRRRVEGQEPDGRDPQVLQVIELLVQSLEVSVPITEAVGESANVNLVEDGILVPERIVFRHE